MTVYCKVGQETLIKVKVALRKIHQNYFLTEFFCRHFSKSQSRLNLRSKTASQPLNVDFKLTNTLKTDSHVQRY